MKFSDFEQLMSEKGVFTLAEIARKLNTTPQAVSNWKARNQVPFHIVARIKEKSIEAVGTSQLNSPSSLALIQQESINFSQILLIIAEQLKLIAIICFISVFITFTYVKFIKQPLYVSKATVLLPEENNMNLGGLAGLASQFGVQVPSGMQADLSSPTLFPDLVKSRTFAEKILDKEFYVAKHDTVKSLIEILSGGSYSKKADKNILIVNSMARLSKILKYEKKLTSPFSILRVTTPDASFSKALADTVLIELEALNLFYKSKAVNEKINFIDNRIKSVDNDLKLSEQRLKIFNERNRQISSPSLQLEQDRLSRGLEIQKGIYLTLQQQLELAKIEEIRQTSVMQILDYPQLAIDADNINTRMNLILAVIIGVSLGVGMAFARNYINNDDISERKRIRKIKLLLNAKFKDLFKDYRVSGIISVFFLIGLPIILSNQSIDPDYFGMYSKRIMFINSIYVIVFIFSSCLYFYLKTKNKKPKN